MMGRRGRPGARRCRLGAGLVAGALLTLAPGIASAQGVGLPVGTELPDFVTTDLAGEEVHIRDVVVPGRPAVIEIWATWCAICAALQPTLEDIHHTHGDAVSIVAIAVSVNQSRAEVAAHVERAGHDWPFLYDEDGAAVRALEVYATGIVLLIDADGRVAWSAVATPRGVRSELEKLLAVR